MRTSFGEIGGKWRAAIADEYNDQNSHDRQNRLLND